MVSVLVPVFNAQTTLNLCVRSLLQQTYQDIEVILVDDGSTDNSPAICDEIAENDLRVRVIHKPNGGVSSARNEGIKAASGDYMMFVDSDDWIEPDTIETALCMLESNNADVCVYSFIDEYGTFSNLSGLDDRNCHIRDLIIDNKSVKNIFAVLCSVCNKLYKTRIIQENGICFDGTLPFGEDFTFNSKVFAVCPNVLTSSYACYHYDRSRENTGAKKLYPNFDEIILKMDRAVLCFLHEIQLDQNDDANEFRESFICTAWKYAFDICLNSRNTIKEKSKIILRWLSTMPEEMKGWKSIQNCELGYYVRKLQRRKKRLCISAMYITATILLKKRIRKMIVKMKLLLRKVLK